MLRTRIAHFALSLMMLLSGGLAFAPALVHADDSFKAAACNGVDQVTGDSCKGNPGQGINNLVKAIIQILSFVVGVAAVIMVIVGGFKFITAGGESSAVASARSTILYALVGLIIVAIAQILVHYVINKAS